MISVARPTVLLIIFQLLMLAAFGLVVFADASSVGFDYCYFLPRLLEGLAFFKAQGLAIPHYSPAFCGGVPFYANAQSMFYSFPQFVGFFVHPWTAVCVTICAALLVQTAGTYLLCRRCLSLSAGGAALAAVFFASNGFFVARMAAGQLTYHSIVLLPVLLLLLLDRRISLAFSCAGIALCAAYYVYSGGYYTTFVSALSIGMVMGIALAQPGAESNAAGMRTLALRIFWGGAGGLALSCSKLTAVAAITRQVSRDAEFTRIPELIELINLILSQLFLPLPSNWSGYGPWEKCMLLHPFAAVGAILWILDSIKRKDHRLSTGRSIGLLLALGSFFAALGLIAGVPAMERLVRAAGLGALRANLRFTASFLLPVSILAAAGIDRRARVRTKARCLTAAALTAPLLCACLLSWLKLSVGGVDSTGLDRIYQQIQKSTSPPSPALVAHRRYSLGLRAAGEPEAGTKGGRTDAPNEEIAAYASLTSLIECYDPLFMARSPGRFVLREAPPASEEDSYFNMLNPSCLVYPEENNCGPGERIRADKPGSLALLLERKPADWRISSVQAGANRISLFSMLVLAVICVTAAVQSAVKRFGREPRRAENQ